MAGDEGDDAPGGTGEETLTDLRQIGSVTADLLSAAGFDAEDVRRKRVSYRDLVEAGVNAGVAAKIRREHSLPWTIDDAAADLDRRSRNVRGLRDGEREWVANANSRDDGRDRDGEREWVERSYDGAEADGSGDAAAAEAAWRERATSDPVTVLAGVDADAASRLADAGVDTVRRLATSDPEHLADRVGTSVERVREWVAAAKSRTD